MLYVLWSFLVSPSWYLCKKVHVLTYIVSAEVGSLVLSQILCTYIHVMKYSCYFNKWKYMCDIRTCLLWLNSSSVGVDVTPNCILRNQDHALCMMSTRFWYNSGGLFKESHTVTRDRSISITSRIKWKLLIHTYGYKKCYIYIHLLASWRDEWLVF